MTLSELSNEDRALLEWLWNRCHDSRIAMLFAGLLCAALIDNPQRAIRETISTCRETLEPLLLPHEMWTETEIVHIWRQVKNGRGKHGDFLRGFADTITWADPENLRLLLPVAVVLIKKYELSDYLMPAKENVF